MECFALFYQIQATQVSNPYIAADHNEWSAASSKKESEWLWVERNSRWVEETRGYQLHQLEEQEGLPEWWIFSNRIITENKINTLKKGVTTMVHVWNNVVSFKSLSVGEALRDFPLWWDKVRWSSTLLILNQFPKSPACCVMTVRGLKNQEERCQSKNDRKWRASGLNREKKGLEW